MVSFLSSQTLCDLLFNPLSFPSHDPRITVWKWFWNVTWPSPVLLGGKHPTNTDLEWRDDCFSFSRLVVPIGFLGLTAQIITNFSLCSAKNLFCPPWVSFHFVLHRYGEELLSIFLKQTLLELAGPSEDKLEWTSSSLGKPLFVLGPVFSP